MTSSSQILIIEHISKLIPSRENNIILPVARLTGCSRVDRSTFRDCRRLPMFVREYMCGRKGKKSEKDLSFLYKCSVVVLAQDVRCLLYPTVAHRDTHTLAKHTPLFTSFPSSVTLQLFPTFSSAFLCRMFFFYPSSSVSILLHSICPFLNSPTVCLRITTSGS